PSLTVGLLNEALLLSLQTDAALGRTVEFLNRLAEVTVKGFEQVQKNIDALAAKQAETDERINRLVSAQAETGERPNKMIIVVERHISEGYHGRPRPE
ncbi:MAG TPA: hypothetical protein VG148_05970, partial [Pyrinomonadaceae bacterium]|nr:hypothetical protein [Pyrinomonadaceae bacterium]